uniref:Uncharacterized protein n=1 Tax=Timema tahoe TaxID=61484 RepID=A0A7R9P0Q9_9NEOP|nr:unnamed protein product [Timema tahoe]
MRLLKDFYKGTNPNAPVSKLLLLSHDLSVTLTIDTTANDHDIRVLILGSYPQRCSIGRAVGSIAIDGVVEDILRHGDVLGSSSISSSPSSSLDSCCSLIILALSWVPQTVISSAAMYSSYVQSGANLCHKQKESERDKGREKPLAGKGEGRRKVLVSNNPAWLAPSASGQWVKSDSQFFPEIS